MKILLVCYAVFITVVTASYQPCPLPFKYGPTNRGVYAGAGGHGGGHFCYYRKMQGEMVVSTDSGGGLSGKDGHVNP